MRIEFKIATGLLKRVHEDLARPHSFAAERVGFVFCKVASVMSRSVAALAFDYQPVDDQDYVNNPLAGATMGPRAIRKALQVAYNDPVSVFHVHVHGHHGQPSFSSIDLRETKNFVPDFWHVRPLFPHGALVLSLDSFSGLCWVPGRRRPVRVSSFTVVGNPMMFIRD
jgi:hypothetical protein